MESRPANSRSPRPTPSILLVFAFQLVIGGVTLLLALRGARIEYFSDQAYPDPGAGKIIATLSLVAAIWIINSFGLLRLRNWSRWLSLLLTSAAALAGLLGVLLYKRQFGIDFEPALFFLLLVLSVPTSIWWWILFTRESVRNQFR